jgi:hypothetical protein
VFAWENIPLTHQMMWKNQHKPGNIEGSEVGRALPNDARSHMAATRCPRLPNFRSRRCYDANSEQQACIYLRHRGRRMQFSSSSACAADWLLIAHARRLLLFRRAKQVRSHNALRRPERSLHSDGRPATGEAYCLAHHVKVDGGKRRHVGKDARRGLFAERLLDVDWMDERALS